MHVSKIFCILQKNIFLIDLTRNLIQIGFVAKKFLEISFVVEPIQRWSYAGLGNCFKQGSTDFFIHKSKENGLNVSKIYSVRSLTVLINSLSVKFLSKVQKYIFWATTAGSTPCSSVEHFMTRPFLRLSTLTF